MRSVALAERASAIYTGMEQMRGPGRGSPPDSASRAGLMIHVDHKSGIPLYVQIGEQLRLLVATGKLSPGDQLPTIREFSVDLTVNPNTVARAYSELEREGLLATRPGRGTFVTGPPDKSKLQEISQEKLEQFVDRMLTEARNLGYSLSEIEACVRQQIVRWCRQEKEGNG